QDLRHAFRSLTRTPGFALLAIATLGLAIGVNVGIFSVVETVLIDPLPFRDPDRLVYLGASAPGSDFPDEFPAATEFYVHYRDQSENLEGIATYNGFTSTLRVGDRIERISMSAPTASLFDTLGVRPLHGRLPAPEDEGRVAVISHTLWQTWFGGDLSVLGQTHYVSGEDREIIGIMGPDFWFPSDETLLWFPRVVPEEFEVGRFGQRMVARMAPGAEPQGVAAELEVLARQLPETFGGTGAYVELIQQHRPVVRSIRDELLGNISAPLWILLGSMGLVLLIACANVANLFMVRAEGRLSDLAVRRALGAARGRLVLSQLAESGIVAAFAGLLAVAVAWAGVPLLLSAAPAEVPRLGQVAVGPGTLLFAFALSVASALLCGLVPALRFSAPRMMRLREGGRGNTQGRHWGRHVLVAGQTALALVLLIGSALLMRSFERLRAVDPGYDTADLYTFQIAPESPSLEDAPSYARFHLDFMDRVAALPGVERVGLVENVPLNEGVGTVRFRNETTPEGEEGPLVSFTWAAGDYFEAMGIERFQGRTFEADDHSTRLGNVLVSRSAADLLWPGRDPIGQRVQMQGQEVWETVIGVVDDVRQYGFRQPAEPMVYFPLVGQDPENRRTISSPAYVVKTPRASEIGAEIRELVRRHAPNAPMYRTFTLERLAADSMAQLSFITLTLGIASVLALILGVVGLYGVLSYAVAARTREIGLRMALGAAAPRVRRMILGQGAKVLAIGIALGAVLAFIATRALRTLLFGIEAFDLGTYLAVAALMVGVGLLATYVPAWRASRVDPMVSLRSE
ncbi:MAG: ABC transporter permease, partial [Acidobacteriota bacterium]